VPGRRPGRWSAIPAPGCGSPLARVHSPRGS